MVSNYSSTVTINTFDEDGNPLNVHDTSEPIEIVIPRSNMPRVSAELVESAVMSSKEGDDSSLFYYTFNVSANDTSISVEIQPEDDTAQFLVLLRYATFPQLNGTDKGWDYLQNVPISIRNSSESADGWINFDPSKASQCILLNLFCYFRGNVYFQNLWKTAMVIIKIDSQNVD